MTQTINFWPVIVSAVVAFAIGALWYSPFLFGKQWMRLMKMSESDIQNANPKEMWSYYLVHFIVTLVSFSVLAFLISLTRIANPSEGAFLGFFVWLGFVAPIGVSELLWEKKSFKLIFINTTQVLLGLVIGGVIMGVWK